MYFTLVFHSFISKHFFFVAKEFCCNRFNKLFSYGTGYSIDVEYESTDGVWGLQNPTTAEEQMLFMRTQISANWQSWAKRCWHLSLVVHSYSVVLCKKFGYNNSYGGVGLPYWNWCEPRGWNCASWVVLSIGLYNTVHAKPLRRPNRNTNIISTEASLVVGSITSFDLMHLLWSPNYSNVTPVIHFPLLLQAMAFSPLIHEHMLSHWSSSDRFCPCYGCTLFKSKLSNPITSPCSHTTIQLMWLNVVFLLIHDWTFFLF